MTKLWRSLCELLPQIHHTYLRFHDGYDKARSAGLSWSICPRRSEGHMWISSSNAWAFQLRPERILCFRWSMYKWRTWLRHWLNLTSNSASDRKGLRGADWSKMLQYNRGDEWRLTRYSSVCTLNRFTVKRWEGEQYRPPSLQRAGGECEPVAKRGNSPRSGEGEAAVVALNGGAVTAESARRS